MVDSPVFYPLSSIFYLLTWWSVVYFRKGKTLSETFKRTFWLFTLILLGSVVLGVASCGGSSLILGQPGQPTLVFIYTDT